MPVALPELIVYALLFFALAFAFASRRMTQAILGPIIRLLQSIPAIGGTLASPLQAVETAIVNACYSIEHGVDSLIGSSWHATARLADWLWREIRSHAGVIAQSASVIGLLIAAYRGLKALVHHFTRVTHAVGAGVKTLEREYRGIEHRVKALERDITKGIGHDLRIRVKALERELGSVESQVIPDIRSIANTAENDVTALGKWVRDNALIAGTTAVVGAVAWALSRLGLDWLRCNSNPFKGNKNACGLWKVLGDVLALAGFLTLAFDFPEFVSAAETVASGIGSAVASIEGTFAPSLPPLPPPV